MAASWPGEQTSTSRRVRRALLLAYRDPRALSRILRAGLRGLWYALWFRARRRGTIHLPFYAYEKVVIEGPGKVVIGRGCSVMTNRFKGLSIVTLCRSARVVIGRGCDLGGLALRCRELITVGEQTLTAASLVQDCLFVRVEDVRSHNPAARRVSPVALGRNVWVGGSCCILCGSQIGDDVVLARGCLCLGICVAPYCLVSGNPSGRALRIAQWREPGGVS